MGLGFWVPLWGKYCSVMSVFGKGPAVTTVLDSPIDASFSLQAAQTITLAIQISAAAAVCLDSRSLSTAISTFSTCHTPQAVSVPMESRLYIRPFVLQLLSIVNV